MLKNHSSEIHFENIENLDSSVNEFIETINKLSNNIVRRYGKQVASQINVVLWCKDENGTHILNNNAYDYLNANADEIISLDKLYTDNNVFENFFSRVESAILKTRNIVHNFYQKECKELFGIRLESLEELINKRNTLEVYKNILKQDNKYSEADIENYITKFDISKVIRFFDMSYKPMFFSCGIYIVHKDYFSNLEDDIKNTYIKGETFNLWTYYEGKCDVNGIEYNDSYEKECIKLAKNIKAILKSNSLVA